VAELLKLQLAATTAAVVVITAATTDYDYKKYNPETRIVTAETSEASHINTSFQVVLYVTC